MLLDFSSLTFLALLAKLGLGYLLIKLIDIYYSKKQLYKYKYMQFYSTPEIIANLWNSYYRFAFKKHHAVFVFTLFLIYIPEILPTLLSLSYHEVYVTDFVNYTNNMPYGFPKLGLPVNLFNTNLTNTPNLIDVYRTVASQIYSGIVNDNQTSGYDLNLKYNNISKTKTDFNFQCGEVAKIIIDDVITFEYADISKNLILGNNFNQTLNETCAIGSIVNATLYNITDNYYLDVKYTTDYALLGPIILSSNNKQYRISASITEFPDESVKNSGDYLALRHTLEMAYFAEYGYLGIDAFSVNIMSDNLTSAKELKKIINFYLKLGIGFDDFPEYNWLGASVSSGVAIVESAAIVYKTVREVSTLGSYFKHSLFYYRFTKVNVDLNMSIDKTTTDANLNIGAYKKSNNITAYSVPILSSYTLYDPLTVCANTSYGCGAINTTLSNSFINTQNSNMDNLLSLMPNLLGFNQSDSFKYVETRIEYTATVTILITILLVLLSILSLAFWKKGIIQIYGQSLAMTITSTTTGAEWATVDLVYNGKTYIEINGKPLQTEDTLLESQII